MKKKVSIKNPSLQALEAQNVVLTQQYKAAQSRNEEVAKLISANPNLAKLQQLEAENAALTQKYNAANGQISRLMSAAAAVGKDIIHGIGGRQQQQPPPPPPVARAPPPKAPVKKRPRVPKPPPDPALRPVTRGYKAAAASAEMNKTTVEDESS